MPPGSTRSVTPAPSPLRLDDGAVHGREHPHVVAARGQAAGRAVHLEPGAGGRQLHPLGRADEPPGEVVEADRERAVRLRPHPGVPAVVEAIERQVEAEVVRLAGRLRSPQPLEVLVLGAVPAVEAVRARAAGGLAGELVPAGPSRPRAAPRRRRARRSRAPARRGRRAGPATRRGRGSPRRWRGRSRGPRRRRRGRRPRRTRVTRGTCQTSGAAASSLSWGKRLR